MERNADATLEHPKVELGRVLYKDERIEISFATYDDIDDLYKVINWAYRGKPNSASELYSGWVAEQHLLSGTRIRSCELKDYIDKMKEENPPKIVILVAKHVSNSQEQKIVVGSFKVELYDRNLQTEEEKQDGIAVEFGLNSVDPDYQGQRIGTLMWETAVRVAKEYFNAKRIYGHIFHSKTNLIDWKIKQGYQNTGRLIPFVIDEQHKSFYIPKVDIEQLKFAVLTKRLE
ncbi:unnamed protein product [Didymodactylos carnosus]|uniref:N-acetyltransferase domain-containing protein n=1 Tax=Didymodactylos carnosus TaxID=1234261 RepID=A0A814BAV1_9BILA|nr:unnamed protein product [Didymodactylos carnosus]CAF1114928.1 unnamed protein product [Didymodactylos carnosus]CAF3705319.1 unnamed protein product [Didymodactylos carnosus]CAF3884886.1 unnamed protein product [Didymodactylos carnosus]